MTPTFVLAVLIKGVLVLSIALGLSLLFRNASAAVRHGVWVAAFVALLALPMLEAMGPKWSVPVGPAPTSVESVFAVTAPVPPMPPVPPVPPPPPNASMIALERHAAEMERHAERIERQAEHMAARIEHEMTVEMHQLERQLEHEATHMTTVSSRHATGSNAHSIVLASSPASVVHTIRSVPREIVLGMLWFWGLGALAVGLMWGVAYHAAARAVRIGTPETDPDRLATWERILLLSDVRRPVRLLRSPALDVPIAWGWGDAAVVLPKSADTWDEDRLEAVLLHELAHILRGDGFSQLLAQVALVLHWANPLAWLAYRNFLLEREHACDDVVIEHGARPSAYAGHLVQVARDLRRRSAALAAVAPMARRSNLEGRVRSILDPAKKRATLSRTAGAILTLLLCAIAMPVAALQLDDTSEELCDPPCEAEVVTPPAEPAPIAPVSAPAAIASSTLDTDAADPLALEIAEATDAVAAVELAMQSTAMSPQAMQPLNIRLALDTIPRFEDVIRPALDAALRTVRELRDSERSGHLDLSDDDWDEMEDDIREAIEDARESYDEAIAEAIEDALDDMDDDWEVAWSDQPDGSRVYGLTTDEALRNARREVDRAQAEARRSMHQAQRDIERQAERQRRRMQARARAEANSRPSGAGARSNRERSAARANASESFSQSYSLSTTSAGGNTVTVHTSRGDTAGWESGLEGLDKGLDNIERSIRQLERANGSAHPSALSGLSAGLAGIRTGLAGIQSAASAPSTSASDKRRVKARIRSTRDRIDALQERLSDCDD